MDNDKSKMKDEFGIINTHIKGLAKFIMEVETPFSISIEGDWGSGKSTIMNFVKEKIKEKCKIVDFNAWEYSQLCEEKFLPFYFIKVIEKELGVEDDKSMVKKIIYAGTRILSLATSRYLDKKISEKTNNLIEFNDVATELNNIFSDDKITQLEKIKSEFSSLINSKIENNSRLIIFIDDLDRILPKTAIEILDLIKNFIDCKNCVFIFAVDMEIVRLGLKAKYGDAFADKKRQENYFDKIMRITYKVPVTQYDYREYLSKKIQIKNSKKEIDMLIDIIDSTIGRNPRTINKIFDTYNLFNNIHENLKENSDKIALFALLCLQNSNIKFYNYLLEKFEYIVDKIDDIKSFDDSLDRSKNIDCKIFSYDATKDEEDNITKWFNSFDDFVSYNDSFKKIIKINRKEQALGRRVYDYGALENIQNISSIIANELKIIISKNDNINHMDYSNNNLFFTSALLDKYLPMQNEEYGFWDDNKKNKYAYLCGFSVGHGKISFFVAAKLRGLNDECKNNLEKIYKATYGDKSLKEKFDKNKMCTLYNGVQKLANEISDEKNLREWVNECIDTYLNWEKEKVK